MFRADSMGRIFEYFLIFRRSPGLQSIFHIFFIALGLPVGDEK